jgi:hypothetical protein
MTGSLSEKALDSASMDISSVINPLIVFHESSSNAVFESTNTTSELMASQSSQNLLTKMNGSASPLSQLPNLDDALVHRESDQTDEDVLSFEDELNKLASITSADSPPEVLPR